MNTLNNQTVIDDHKLNLERVIFKIKYNRAHNGISQQEMAKKLDMSHRKYQRIEALESTPSLEMLFQTAKILGVKFEELTSPSVPTNMPEKLEVLGDSEEELLERFPELANTDFLSLCNSGKIETLLEDLESCLKLPEFFESNTPLFLADYNTAYINDVLAKASQRTNHSRSTLQGLGDKKGSALSWDIWTCYDIKYCISKDEVKMPAGNMTFYSLMRIFKDSKGKPITFGTILNNDN